MLKLEPLDFDDENGRKMKTCGYSVIHFGHPLNMIVVRGASRLKVYHKSLSFQTGGYYGDCRFRVSRRGDTKGGHDFSLCQKIKSLGNKVATPANNLSMIKLDDRSFLWTNVGSDIGYIRLFQIDDYRCNFRNSKTIGCDFDFSDENIKMLRVEKLNSKMFCSYSCQWTTEKRRFQRGLDRECLNYRDCSRGEIYSSRHFWLFSKSSEGGGTFDRVRVPKLERYLHNRTIVISSKMFSNSVFIYSGGIPRRSEIVFYHLEIPEIEVKNQEEEVDKEKEKKPIQVKFLQRVNVSDYGSIVDMKTYSARNCRDEILVYITSHNEVHFCKAGKSCPPFRKVSIRREDCSEMGVRLTEEYIRGRFSSLTLCPPKHCFVGTEGGNVITFPMSENKVEKGELFSHQYRTFFVSPVDISRFIRRAVSFLDFSHDEADQTFLMSICDSKVLKFVKIRNLLTIGRGEKRELTNKDFQERISFIFQVLSDGDDTSSKDTCSSSEYAFRICFSIDSSSLVFKSFLL